MSSNSSSERGGGVFDGIAEVCWERSTDAPDHDCGASRIWIQTKNHEIRSPWRETCTAKAVIKSKTDPFEHYN